MTKIVIDAREFGSGTTGRYIEKLLANLQEIDHTHTYVVLLKPKHLDDWQPTNKRFRKVACRYKEFTFGEQLGFRRQLKRLKPDLVHFGMTQQPILYRGRVVTTIHDLTTVRFRNPDKNRFVFWFKQLVYRWVIKRAARKSAAVLTASHFVKQDVARFARVNSRKIVVTYEAADRIMEHPEPLPLLVDKPFIFYIGRPNPHKNLRRLVEAFARLKTTYPELTLVLAGKLDHNYRALRHWVNRQHISNVSFTDRLSEGELRWLYEHAKAYVFPSLSEGFGLPGLEAMMHGCPVISSNATCLPEIYKDGAVYFDPLDTTAMAEAIAKVIDDDKLAHKLVIKGSLVAKDYSWRRLAAQTLAVYKAVLGERVPHQDLRTSEPGETSYSSSPVD